MTEPVPGFDAQWLRQREPLDRAARNASLARAFVRALSRQPLRPLNLIDLAAGSGANFRLLAPLIGGHQDWLLVDHDAGLLAEQQGATRDWAARQGWLCTHSGQDLLVHADGARWRLRTQALDLASACHELALQRFDGLVTTAFLDLVSAAWLDHFSSQVARSGRPLLATLTVDGRREWWPTLPADEALQAAFDSHQRGDKGFGPALGPDAAQYLAQRLSDAGLTLHSAYSDWRIGPDQPDLLQRLIDEAASVVTQTRPDLAATARAWQTERQRQCQLASLNLTVGHLDLLALPRA